MKGREGFEKHYAGVFGERWPALREALGQPVKQVARVNRFADPAHIDTRSAGRTRVTFAGCEALVLEPAATRAEPAATGAGQVVTGTEQSASRFELQADASGLFDFYVMDPASIFAARALEVQAGDEVLDLCAAPGGKTLILAESLAEEGRLTANEMSDKRRGRLRAVLEDYLPADIRSRVSVSGHDGARWCLHETNAFDRILVDAPCSGERHLLDDPAEMKVWSPARSKNLAVRQYALLVSALQVVRPGGRIVYSTCSLSPLENDAVIARLLKKRAGEARVVSQAPELGEPTEHGWMILPDRTGYGPIYFAALERV